jgi:hypothetical protein
MVSIHVEVIIEARPDQVWTAIADVGAVHERLLPGRVTAVRMDGDTLVLTMPDGTEVRGLNSKEPLPPRALGWAVT